MNLLLHRIPDAAIRNGDTLLEPKHIADGQLMRFDRVNPPTRSRRSAKAMCSRRWPSPSPCPDDVEARAPRAQLRVDNTSQEIIAALRGLIEPLAVTLQIVRAGYPDVIEREWSGLEWRSSTYDLAFVSGGLGEEFPYETFDGRFAGLWP